MGTMTYRTTFALDGVSARLLKELSARWQVSQAEVVRRALAQAERQTSSAPAQPLARLKQYHAEGGLDRRQAEAYLARVYQERKHWRGP